VSVAQRRSGRPAGSRGRPAPRRGGYGRGYGGGYGGGYGRGGSRGPRGGQRGYRGGYRGSRRPSVGPSRRTFSPLVLGVLGAVVAGLLGLVAYSQGLRISLPQGGGQQDAGSRFTGASGVVIPETDPPDFWWMRVTTDNDLVGSEYLPGVPASMRFRRVVVPSDVLFTADSAEISSDYDYAIERIVESIANPTLRVAVVCHSSAGGTPALRQPLSEKRADALADVLELRLGRAPGSMLRIGKGDTVPLPGVGQNSPTGRALHRRCEVFVEVA